ncbi:hypothetical protein HHK36_001865 [Tetracentron sinense]|uniref:Legume lectin domain-containing protein n=1 Tax=Tetracentron sinense TaxID=13715 RepID=A0A835A3F8_TETSI|nr:hypothetical protein HHK36_001865 [Tetracentron sinense]
MMSNPALWECKNLIGMAELSMLGQEKSSNDALVEHWQGQGSSFDSSDLLFYGNAMLEFCILTLTNDTTCSMGRALYLSKIPTKSSSSSNLLPFSISFIFSIVPSKDHLPGQGLIFILVPSTAIEGVSAAQHLDLLNQTNESEFCEVVT